MSEKLGHGVYVCDVREVMWPAKRVDPGAGRGRPVLYGERDLIEALVGPRGLLGCRAATFPSVLICMDIFQLLQRNHIFFYDAWPDPNVAFG